MSLASVSKLASFLEPKMASAMNIIVHQNKSLAQSIAEARQSQPTIDWNKYKVIQDQSFLEQMKSDYDKVIQSLEATKTDVLTEDQTLEKLKESDPQKYVEKLSQAAGFPLNQEKILQIIADGKSIMAKLNPLIERITKIVNEKEFLVKRYFHYYSNVGAAGDIDFYDKIIPTTKEARVKISRYMPPDDVPDFYELDEYNTVVEPLGKITDKRVVGHHEFEDAADRLEKEYETVKEKKEYNEFGFAKEFEDNVADVFTKYTNEVGK